ncbi:hypothetical protein KQR54_32990 [Mycobacterium gordonae]|uniref:hypothetical protein n=1 Tax=Mycobacterium gordonae TaxID=1778 RepID=UPI0021087D6D|nr:hypothetical protein [Mycobacterium gordonae]MCQ4365833.1 hypothetical protein [Mycobacterium gordonae]
MTEIPGPTPAAEITEPADDSLDLPHNLEAARKLRGENRNLRERLRTLEGDFERAITRLDALQTAEVQRVAAEHLVDGTDIWTGPAALSDFLDEYGVPDAAKVADAAKAITENKPHLAKAAPVSRPPSDRPVESLRPGATPSDFKPDPQPTWGSAIGSRVGPPR